MLFKTKRDRFFIYLWIGLILFINAIFIFPVFLDPPDAIGLWIIIVMDVLATVSLIWCAVDIRYELRTEYLYVKGGPFRSRIKYSDITRITGDPNLWVGYRILFSKDAIAVHYRTGVTGNVVISPENIELFIAELLKHNNSIKVDLK